MHSRIVLLVAVLFLPPVMKAAGDAPLDRATLRGLGSVSVIVDPIDSELLKEGLTQDLLQKRIQGRLRDAGIGVDPSAPEFVGLRVLQVRAQRGPLRAVPLSWRISTRFADSEQGGQNRDGDLGGRNRPDGRSQGGQPGNPQ